MIYPTSKRFLPIFKKQPISLTFTAKSASNIVLKKYNSPSAVTLQYNKNDTGWTDYTIGDQIDLNTGEFVKFSGANDYFSRNYNHFYYFQMDGTIEASGNIQSLMNFSDTAPSYAYFAMFMGCTSLVSLPDLPATTIGNNCYSNTFNGCSNISSIQSNLLPATTLAQSCYGEMFGNCTSLVDVSNLVLPATTLANDCYEGLFQYCTNLTGAPNLPATELAQNCYSQMFMGCTSLVTAPQLPATGLAAGCYNQMFEDCTSLASISVSFTDWRNDILATNIWTRNVAAIGTFTKPVALSAEFGDNRIPNGWTVVDYTTMPLTFKSTGDTAVSINNSNLSYKKNTGQWTAYTANDTINLTSGDVVSFSGTNTRMAEGSSMSGGFSTSGTGSLTVYGNPHSLINYGSITSYAFCDLFARCGNIVDASNVILSATSLDTACYMGMFSRNTSLTAAPNLPASSLAYECYYHMFSYCYALSTAPELSATTLRELCYMHMFNSCSSLLDAPILPATSLATGSYDYMFSRCTSLTSINVNFTEWGNSTNWVENVAPTGIFTKPEALTARVGYNFVPYNWTVINK